MFSTNSASGALVVVRWGPVEFRITSSDREVLLWAHHHLTPTVNVVQRNYVAHSIDVVIDTDLVAVLRAELSATRLSLFESYSADAWVGGVIGTQRMWMRRSIAAGAHDSLVLIEESACQWRLVTASSDAARPGVVRLAREILRTELAQCGAYTFHASCAVDERLDGFLFCGESGAGKTTLALATAQAGYLVSGDQTEVFRDDQGRLTAVGFPWSLRVTSATLRGLGHGYDFARLLVRPPPTLAGERTDDSPAEKLEFSGLETEVLLRVPILPECAIRGIAVVREDLSLPVPFASFVQSSRVTQALAQHLREPDPSFGSFWLAPDSSRPADTQELVTLKEVVGDVPVVDLAWAPARHSAARALEAVGLALARSEAG